MYKKASKLKLRFPSSKGLLSVEQLWDLNLNSLTQILSALDASLSEKISDRLNFIDNVNVEDEETSLKFDIVKDIYITKKSEIQASKDEHANKEHNQKIMAIIAEKQENNLKNMSIEDLTALLK